MLVTRFLYPGWAPETVSSMLFWVGGLVWSFCVWRSVRELPRLLKPRECTTAEDRFDDAQAAYLQGDLETAEVLLQEVLAIEARDPPALLLLCGVFRQTGRIDSAMQLIDEAARLEVCDGWAVELQGERDRLDRAAQKADSAGQPDSQQPESHTPDSQQPDHQQPDHQQPDHQQPDHQRAEMQTPDKTPPESVDVDQSTPWLEDDWDETGDFREAA
ncbi:MAG: tetratricopeptide repeat protein [Planctomycetota bacterium]